MDRKLLGIYLNDHLAGSVVGTRLARRIAKHNEGNHYGSEATSLAKEIEQDKATLEELMDRLDVRKKRVRLAVAAVTETAGRLKPNGRLVGYSPLSRVIELEALTIGITGKLELWQSLKATGERIDGVDPDQLIERAEDQRSRVRDLRLQASREAFS
ncbi:MAG TPA: hypothetical protein VLB79_00650 [Solirubrobacterales bacterium]|nr:hypothetical protein [Solirubrobacterales bacterium]